MGCGGDESQSLADAQLDLGNEYLEQADLDSAFKSFDAAIKIKPDYATGYCNRGFVYLLRGERTQAIADFETAIA